MIKKELLSIMLIASVTLCGCEKSQALEEESLQETVENSDVESSEEDIVETDNSSLAATEESSPKVDIDQTDQTEESGTWNDDVFFENNIYGNGYDSWEDAYASYIEENGFEDATSDLEYSLIYLDDDDQPELYINSMVEAGGEIVLTYYEGSLKYLYLSRIGSLYIPSEGLIYNNCGHMDYYPVYIYKLANGEFSLVAHGIWGGLDWENSVETDENGDLAYQYEWEGVRYSEEEFYNKINEVFPIDEGVRPETWYCAEELVTILRTGHNSAYGHRYELFIDEDPGWIEGNGKIVDGHVSTDFEYYCYPGYSFGSTEWEYSLGQIGLMKYSTETGKIYMFGAPMDLLEYAPQYAGKIGYICEYDE